MSLATRQPAAASLYLHIPFCKTRCAYCDFNTYAGLEARLEGYVDALRREIELAGESIEGARLEAPSLYLGGGTPSLLSPRQVETILDTCQCFFDLPSGAEISIEANPGTIDGEKLRRLRQAGINRLSLGVQSAHAEDLKRFNRGHSFEEAADAFTMARQAGYDNIGIDLIYGAPWQTLAGWRDTLTRVLGWEPDHVSLYSLTIEEGTPLARQIARGLLGTPDPDLAADMYDEARTLLPKAGLRQYEISNWARPGHECRHNRQYWLNEPYLGFGAGAYGTFGGLRYWNVKRIGDYVERVKQAEVSPFPPSSACEGQETIDQDLAMAETMILGLRMTTEGVSRQRFARRFGRPIDAVFGDVIARLSGLGLLIDNGQSVRLAEHTYLVSNQIFVHFLDAKAKR